MHGALTTGTTIITILTDRDTGTTTTTITTIITIRVIILQAPTTPATDQVTPPPREEVPHLSPPIPAIIPGHHRQVTDVKAALAHILNMAAEVSP